MSFSDLKQQLTIGQQLHRSLESGRLAHAYLFVGPRGSGKEAVARTLAKALNCLNKNDDCCPENATPCDSCRRVDGNVHPDVYWVRPESKSRRIQVDQMREFMQAINLRSTMARVKVGIVVDAECMSDEASNAFLKTLEEPPAQTVILLLCSAPHRLLPTILSRCLKLIFGPVTEKVASPYSDQLKSWLTRFSATDSARIANSYLLLAELTALLQQIRGETRERIETEVNLDRYEQLDPNVRQRLQDQMEARIEGEYRAAREEVLEEFYGWFGDLLLCTEGADDKLLNHLERAAAARRASAGLNFQEAIQNLEAVEQIRDSLFRNISETLAFEVGLLKLT